MGAMSAYKIDIEMFYTLISSKMKHDKDRDYLGIRKTTWFVSMLFSIVNRMFFNNFIKKLQKSSAIYKISITLLSDNITFLSFVSTIKIQKISLCYSFLMNYFISNSR